MSAGAKPRFYRPAAPAIFQRTMKLFLGNLPHVCIYLDDILVTGESDANYLCNLAAVLKRLESAGVRLKQKKCRINDSGSGIPRPSQGIQPVSEKVLAVRDAPTPKDLSQLRSFLGMVTYYGKFLPNMATLMRPLYDLHLNTTVRKLKATCAFCFLFAFSVFGKFQGHNNMHS